MSDPRNLFAKAAGKVPRHVDVGRIVERGEKLRRRRRIVYAATSVLAVGALWIGWVSLPGLGLGGPERGVGPAGKGDAQVSPGQTDAASPTSSPYESQGCSYSEFRPTYLPWISQGQEIPPPDEMSGDGTDSADLVWHRSAQGKPFYVRLGLAAELNPPGPGEPVAASIGDVRGEMEVIDTGDVAIRWYLPSDTCNLLVLEFTTVGEMTTQEAKGEVLKIAQSFQRATSQ